MSDHGRGSSASEHLVQRWEAALREAPGFASDPRTVAQGLGLSRRGRVVDLEIAVGGAHATVRDRVVHQARLRWPPATEEAWARAVGDLAGQARNTVALLERRADDELFGVLDAAGVDVAPGPDSWGSQCTCERDRCAHVAALYAAVCARLAVDPLVVLRMRGKDPGDLLDAVLEQQRGEADEPSVPPDVGFDPTKPIDAARGDLSAIELHPHRPIDPASLVRRLGAPPGVADSERIAVPVRYAAAMAWRLAAGDGAGVADEELLMAELRAQRTASAESLADAIGAEAASLADELDRLYERGAVLRTGEGRDARYRAAR